MINYNPVTNRGGVLLDSISAKGGRTGLIALRLPTLCKGGLRHSETIRGLSDSSGGDS